MALLRKSGGEHLVFEHQELGLLIAVAKSHQSIIKKFWKKYKGKKEMPADVVSGFPFVYNDEQESLVIDFTEEKNYEIKHLKKLE